MTNFKAQISNEAQNSNTKKFTLLASCFDEHFGIGALGLICFRSPDSPEFRNSETFGSCHLNFSPTETGKRANE